MKWCVALGALAIVFGGPMLAPAQVMRFSAPATRVMEEALPVGNGRLGGLVMGGTAHERIILNEISLWTGGENPKGAYDDDFGGYQCLGELDLDFPGHEKATNYSRELDLARGIVTVKYDVDGVTFTREILASRKSDVIILRLTANKSGALSGSCAFLDAHGATASRRASTIQVDGTLSNGRPYYAGLAGVGTRPPDERASILTFSGRSEVRLIFAARTNYALDPFNNFASDGSAAKFKVLNDQLHALDEAAPEGIVSATSEHAELMSRLSIDLGPSTPAQRALDFPARKTAAATTRDAELEALLLQYGRYLLLSSSRPGSLPANLQGLWNDSNNPPWHSDYHANINVQMNYWPAEVANLSECHLPFFDLVESQLPAWRAATAKAPEFNLADGSPTTRGFAIRTSHNIFGGMGWKWDKTANAWYATHFWEHYAFTRDKAFLKDRAYPFLKEVTQFWEDHLKALPDGRLVVPNAWSPEHGPTEDGVSYAQEIVWELFTDYTKAAAELGIDADYAAKIAAMRDHLAMPRVGTWGQLLEWMTEKKGAASGKEKLDTPDDHHRHTSHLFGLYPGSSISLANTPDLARAAKISLTARGDGGDAREWSFAWRTALWARLGDGDTAYTQIQHFLTDKASTPNLFGYHPPVQLDGNFGMTAGMSEMLLQSSDNEILLLPALPKAWPEGTVTGLRARGAFDVDLHWRDGQLTHATVRNLAGKQGTAVRYGTKSWTLTEPTTEITP